MDISANAQHRIAAARRACHASKELGQQHAAAEKAQRAFPFQPLLQLYLDLDLTTSQFIGKIFPGKSAPNNLDLSQNITQAKLYSPPYPLFQNKNIMHNTCPKCSAAIAGGSKTCGSCGSVRPDALFYCV